jgi:hypothetical protein
VELHQVQLDFARHAAILPAAGDPEDHKVLLLGEGEPGRDDLVEELARRDLDALDLHGLGVKQAQFEERLDLLVVAGVADGLVFVGLELPGEGPWAGRGPPSGDEGLAPSDRRGELELLQLGEGLDLPDLAFPEDVGLPEVFVGEPLDAEDELIP